MAPALAHDAPSAELAIAETRAWLEQAVIGLELCPFAKAVHAKGQIRYAVSDAETPEALLEDLLSELRYLADADPATLDTTLLVHPRALSDFLDYNDFFAVVEAVIEELGYLGEIQVASFHADYRFAGNAVDDMANFVTRSPYPMLHLLRESSVTRALQAFPDAEVIIDKNIKTLRGLGLAAWQRLMADLLTPRASR